MPARVERLDALHGALERFWSAAEDGHRSPSREFRLRFDLAVAEVAGNICQHSGSRGSATQIEVDLVLETHAVRAVLQDDGGAVHLPERQGFPSDLEESGRGLEIVRRAADCLRYERTEAGRNRWSVFTELS